MIGLDALFWTFVLLFSIILNDANHRGKVIGILSYKLLYLRNYRNFPSYFHHLVVEYLTWLPQIE